jgi:hypothetical protein
MPRGKGVLDAPHYMELRRARIKQHRRRRARTQCVDNDGRAIPPQSKITPRLTLYDMPCHQSESYLNRKQEMKHELKGELATTSQ